jgi:hypothetical protein
MSILSSTKSGVKGITLTLEDFKKHGFEGDTTMLTKKYNGKTKTLHKQYVWKMSTLEATENYNYQCSINGKTYNIPITNLYTLKLVEEIFVTTEIKKLEKLKRKLYKHVFNHHAPTKAERIEREKQLEKELVDGLRNESKFRK